jgi:biopolymer transport protein ExbD
MAQVEESGGGKKEGKKGRGKKHSPSVDMTPMVDLAFLLITFFMLTTTFSKPQTMQLNMPEKKDKIEETSPVKESETITLLLGEKDRIYWFQGLPTEAKLEVTDYSSEGLRKLILQKTAEVGKNEKGENKIVIIIKPLDKSKYKNMVDVLDEMNITHSQRYAIVDLSPIEKDLVSNYEASNPI